MGYAGKHNVFTYVSWVLSSVSALVALLPFIYIWRIIKEVLDVSPNFSAATGLVHKGIKAVVFAFLSFLFYICGLLCSHLAAFRVATNLRLAVTEHIATLPLGYVDTFGSGKFRKIISDSTGATETYLAHQLPDKAAALATPVGLIVLLFVFDWRLGLLSLVPVLLGFLIMATMTGKSMAEKMRQYSNALANMKVAETDSEKLMSLFSIVFQDVTLFDNTIMENIRLGKKGATTKMFSGWHVLQTARNLLKNCLTNGIPTSVKTIVRFPAASVSVSPLHVRF